MITLTQSLAHWNTDQFKTRLKLELEALPPGSLPLHQATRLGGQVDDSNISVLVNSITDNHKQIKVSIGIFFHEIMAGCSCGDEPLSENSYCEMLVSINKVSAKTIFKIKG